MSKRLNILSSLFRGKSAKTLEWLYGNLVESNGNYLIYYEKPDEMCQSGNWLEYEKVIPETVGQFTGLRCYWTEGDEDFGEPLYTGDIIEVQYEGQTVVAKVEGEAGTFIAVSSEFADGYVTLIELAVFEDDTWLSAKILGNIVGNKEILESEAENE